MEKCGCEDRGGGSRNEGRNVCVRTGVVGVKTHNRCGNTGSCMCEDKHVCGWGGGYMMSMTHVISEACEQ